MKYYDLQVPDAKSGKDKVDTVLVDEEAVGAPHAPGCGAKLLFSNHGMEETPEHAESRDTSVCSLISFSCYRFDCGLNWHGIRIHL